MGIEIDTNKYKFGDGVTEWKLLPYASNIPSNAVYFGEDITLAGSYTAVGNIEKSSGKLEAKGKTVEELFTEIFTKELQPSSKPTQPWIDLKINNSNGYSVEAGTTVTPIWTTTSGAGAYTYKSTVSKEDIKPVDGTGVKFTGWSLKKTGVSDPIGTSASGTGESFVIGDSAVVFEMTGTHTAGNYALSNLNKLAAPEVQIKAGTKSNAVKISSYRKEFAGGTTNMATIDSALIRGLSKSRAATTSEFEFQAAVGDTKLIFAAPKGAHSTPKFEYFTMSWESFAGFKKLDASVKVADVRGGAEGLKDYDVWEYVPAGAFAAPTKFKVKF